MSLDNSLWIGGIAAEILVLGLLLYRRAWKTLPIFCAFCAWELLSDAGDYAILRFFPASYLTTYLVQSVVDAALQLGVLVELAWSVLRPLRASLSSRALWLPAVLIAVVGAAIWPFSGIQEIAGQSSLMRNLVHLVQTVSILRVLLFLLLAGCSQLLSIGWRDRELQIATGLGFYSLVSLAVTMARFHLSLASQYRHLNQVVVASYLCSLLYWVFCFSQQEAERREFTPQMEHFLLALAGNARITRMALGDSANSNSQERK